VLEGFDVPLDVPEPVFVVEGLDVPPFDVLPVPPLVLVPLVMYSSIRL
jgi:hypothetical protein